MIRKIGLLALLFAFACQSNNVMMKENCDPETGICTPTPLEKIDSTSNTMNSQEVIYVGDPMCSWCYGMAPELQKIKEHCEAKGVAFRIVVGGLRPGGGDPWTEEFKTMLKHHWEQVNERSGQEFGYALFDLPTFDYDTEPACRAVLAFRKLKPEAELAFFEAVQEGFYRDSKDPKNVEFYKSICERFGVSFEEFSDLFLSEEVKKATYLEFTLNREWGIRGYPSLLIQKKDELQFLSYGYTTFDEVKKQID